jgi:hypothetical protein
MLYSAGDTSLRGENQFVDGSSGNLKSNVRASGEQRLGTNKIGWSGLSGSASAGAQLKGSGIEASSSGSLPGLCS